MLYRIAIYEGERRQKLRKSLKQQFLHCLYGSKFLHPDPIRSLMVLERGKDNSSSFQGMNHKTFLFPKPSHLHLFLLCYHMHLLRLLHIEAHCHHMCANCGQHSAPVQLLPGAGKSWNITGTECPSLQPQTTPCTVQRCLPPPVFHFPSLGQKSMFKDSKEKYTKRGGGKVSQLQF